MPTGRELVAWMATQIGVGYSWTGRFGPTAYDCSGLGVAALRVHDVEPGGYNSTGLELWCKGEGLGITVAEAEHIIGAPVFIWGYGADGHVAYSLGDGRVIETPSDSNGGAVGISPFWSGRTHNGWTGAGLFPGIDYTETAGTVDPVLTIGSSGAVVTNWQRFLGIADDGIFGDETARTVRAFQTLMGIAPTGVIDQPTWATRRYIEAIPPQAPQPSRPLNQESTTMRMFHDVDADAWCLWDGINWTEALPADRVNALKYAGVPFGDIHGDQLTALRKTVGEHVESLVARVAAATK